MKSLAPMRINGIAREDTIADKLLLIDHLSGTHGLTGTKQGCDGCTVLLDGVPRLA